MSKNLFETYEVNGRQYTDNLGHIAFISIPKKQYIEYEQLKEENKQLKEKLEDKIDLYEDTISYQLGYDSAKALYEKILTELEEWLKDEIRPDVISDTTLMSYSITDKPIKKQVLDYIEKLKEKYK